MDDWVEQAVAGIRFEVDSDTIVVQRLRLGQETVFWFGCIRLAHEITLRRGGFVGFCVWSINGHLDGAKVIPALELAAAELRARALRDACFHSPLSVVAPTLEGDPASFGALVATARPLMQIADVADHTSTVRTLLSDNSIALATQDLSAEVCAQFINSFQAHTLKLSLERLALVASPAVLAFVSKSRHWQVSSAADWLVQPYAAALANIETRLARELEKTDRLARDLAEGLDRFSKLQASTHASEEALRQRIAHVQAADLNKARLEFQNALMQAKTHASESEQRALAAEDEAQRWKERVDQLGTQASEEARQQRIAHMRSAELSKACFELQNALTQAKTHAYESEQRVLAAGHDVRWWKERANRLEDELARVPSAIVSRATPDSALDVQETNPVGNQMNFEQPIQDQLPGLARRPHFTVGKLKRLAALALLGLVGYWLGSRAVPLSSVPFESQDQIVELRALLAKSEGQRSELQAKLNQLQPRSTNLEQQPSELNNPTLAASQLLAEPPRIEPVAASASSASPRANRPARPSSTPSRSSPVNANTQRGSDPIAPKTTVTPTLTVNVATPTHPKVEPLLTNPAATPTQEPETN